MRSFRLSIGLRLVPLAALALGLVASGAAGQLTTRKQLNNILLGNGRCDTFEKVSFTGNLLQLTPSAILDEFTSAGTPAQTGLVSPMVTYEPGPPLAGSVAFLNAGYGGGATKRLWASNSAGITIKYRVAVRAFGMDFHSFPPFGGNLNARIVLADNTVVNVPFTFTNAQTPYFFGFEDSRCIKEVRFQDLTGQAAVNIDNHCFGCPRGRGWCEPFPDWAYPFNTSPHQNAVRGWYLAEGFPNEAGLIQDNYCSPSRGLFLHTTTDLMRDFRCMTNGKYIFSGWWYVPSNSDPTQNTYFMLLNQPYTQPFSFSMQLGANSLVVNFFPVGIQGTEPGDYIVPSNTLATKTNRWVNVCAFIDLTKDRQKVYYDGVLVADVRWRPNITQSLLQIHTINLYGGDLGGTSWMDDLAIVPDCPKTYQIGRNDAFLWGADPTPISSQLLPWLAVPPLRFDQRPVDKSFGASFMGLPSGPCKNFKGRFHSRMRATNLNGANANLDRLWLGLNGATWAYNSPFSTLYGAGWTTAGAQNISVNLDSNVLSTINQTGRLDFMTRWFTGADYARLQLWNCCPCWRGYWWDTVGPIELDFTAAGHLRPDFQPGPGGVVVDLGNSAGAEFTFAGISGLDDLDVGFSLTAIGRVAGQDGQQIGKLNIAGGETAALLTSDFSTSNPSSVRVQLYNQAGTMLTDQARPQNNLALFTQPGGFHIVKWAANCTLAVRQCFIMETSPTFVQVGGSNFGGVAKIVVIGENPANSVTNISHLQLDGRGNPDVEFTNIRGFLSGGLAVSSLGGAGFSSVDGGILVGEVKEPKEEGIRIELPNTNGFRFGLHAIWVPAPEICNTVFQAFANLNGTPNSPVGSIELAEVPGCVFVRADYSAVSSPTTRVRVYRQGLLVTDQTGLPPNSVMLEERPVICEKGGPEIPPRPPCFLLEMASIQPITVNGVQYLGDAVAILAEPTVPTTVTAYSAVEITAGVAEEMFVSNPMALRSISGTVTLQDLEPAAVAGQLVRLEFRYPGEEEILDVKYVNLGANGSYSTVTGLYGPVEVLVKGSHWLRKLVTATVGDSGATGVNASLVNGDCNGDNEVDIGDFAMISSAYGKCVGEPGFQPDADLNGDECVDIGDFAIMSANYGEVGD